MADGRIIIETELATKKFDAQIADLEGKIQDLEKQKIYFEAKGMTGELKDVEVELEKTKNKLVQINKEKAKLEQSAKNNVLGKSFNDAIGKAGKLALAIFGIRSAYLAVRQASSYLASYDKQYAANLEYIKYALTQVIAPVLRWIVSLAAQLLQIIGSIINMLFGINLFSNASAKSFAKMKAGASGTAKAAKEIKKQLAGFDELNILQDNTDTSTGGGGAGATMPDFDFSKMGLDESKLGKIKQLLSELLPFILGIVTALTLMKLGLDAITAIGIGVIIAGAVYAIQGLLAYLKDPTWENFGKVLQGLSIAIIGLGIAIGGPVGLTIAIAGAIAFIVSTIIRNWDNIKAFLQGGIDWLFSKVDWVRKYFGIVGEAIYVTILTLMQSALNIVDIIFNAIRGIFDGFIMFLKGAFTGNWTMAWEGIKKIFITILTYMKNMFMTVYNSIMNLVVKVGQKAGDLISSAFKAVVNTVLGAIENILNNPIRSINSLKDAINGIPGVNIGWHLDEFHLPRLAKGGIINMPSKGVMIGGAIVGEKGAEGVIPLTDAQAMETLGEAIGRYITINANITNSMNGKVLSRELKKIQNDKDFAYNT